MRTSNNLTFEIKVYQSSILEKLFIWFILFLWGFGFLMVFIEVNDKIIARTSVLLEFSLISLWYFYKYFIQIPKITGCISINDKYIEFNKSVIEIKEIEYISINFKDYRGKIKISRTEFPFPSLGINNEIKIYTKKGSLFESNFFVEKKKDRKKIDKYINYWSEMNIRTEYLINNVPVYIS